MFLNIVLGLAIGLATLQFFLFLQSLFFHKILSPYWYRPKYESTTEFPDVHVFVASKGISNDSEKIMRNYATLDYPGNYRVTFITESTQDPGTPLLQSLAEEYEHVRHKVAGRTDMCSQKSHNILVGMEDDHSSEIFAFADADVHVGKNWLTQLVRPLSMGKNWVSTGLPSHTLRKTTIPHLIHAALTTYQAKMVMSVGAIWGGSYALWRETFDGLGTREHWSNTVVDDISLHELIQNNNLRHWWGSKRIHLIPVPELELEVFTSHNTAASATNWFIRQVLYIKFNRRPIWYLAVWANFAGLLLMCVAPFCLFFPSDPELFRIGMIGFSFLMFMQVINLSLTLIRKRNDCSLLQWSKLFVFGDISANIALLSTLFIDRLVWSGITYEVDRNGKVTQVIHPEKELSAPSVNSSEVS